MKKKTFILSILILFLASLYYVAGTNGNTVACNPITNIPADTNCDEFIDELELMDFISEWIGSLQNLQNLLKSIEEKDLRLDSAKFHLENMVRVADQCPTLLSQEAGIYEFKGRQIIIDKQGPIGQSPRTIIFWAKKPSQDKEQEVVKYSGFRLMFHTMYQNRPSNSNIGFWNDVGWGTVIFSCQLNADDNVWHHYALVYEGGRGDTTKLYQDGGLLTNCGAFGGQITLDSGTDPRPIYIGSRPVWFSSMFQGSIGKLIILSRALSQAEILNLYHETQWIKNT